MQRPDRHWNVCNDEDSAGGAVFVTSSGDETVRYPALRTYDEPLADFIAEAGTVYHETGKTPAELAASLADAQAEIARLRGALEAQEVSSHNYFEERNQARETVQKYRTETESLRTSLSALVREYEGYFEGATEPRSLITARAVLK